MSPICLSAGINYTSDDRCRTMQPESSSRHRGGPMPNRWCVNYTGCRFNTELTTRCLCWHTRLWTRPCRGTSANASIAASTHGHYARRLRHCSSNRSLAPTSRNVLFDALRRLSGTHSLRLLSDATHCLYSNLGQKHSYFVSPLTCTHNRLPPAPPKLQPYAALQICLLLLLL